VPFFRFKFANGPPDFYNLCITLIYVKKGKETGREVPVDNIDNGGLASQAEALQNEKGRGARPFSVLMIG
jgi:hypothetical protein